MDEAKGLPRTELDIVDLASYRRRYASLRGMPQKQIREAQLDLRRAENRWVAEFTGRWFAHVAGAEDRLQVALEWFWFNHFNVFWRKPQVGAALPDYVESLLRPLVSGRFRDLLLGVITHPAMLVYLDNAKNVSGKGNENFARELLELHTLGVDGGYTQADVQGVARILTGVGLRPPQMPNWPPDLVGKVREHGEFLFDPRQHDFSEKKVIGHTIPGSGFAEVEILADLLVAHPSTARHLAKRLCLFFWGDDAPEDMVKAVAARFHSTQGDLGMTIGSLQDCLSQPGSAAHFSFKSPMQWLMSAVRLLAGGAKVTNPRPIAMWLTQLGQPAFGRSTPDGYSLRGTDWISSGQLAQRFEVARDMTARFPSLLGGLPRDLLFDTSLLKVETARLSRQSRTVVERAEDITQRAALLISSPEFMYRRPGEDLI